MVVGNGIKADESALTGESEEMTKDTLHACIEKREEKLSEKRTVKASHDIPSPCLISGTKVLRLLTLIIDCSRRRIFPSSYYWRKKFSREDPRKPPN